MSLKSSQPQTPDLGESPFSYFSHPPQYWLFSHPTLPHTVRPIRTEVKMTKNTTQNQSKYASYGRGKFSHRGGQPFSQSDHRASPPVDPSASHGQKGSSQRGGRPSSQSTPRASPPADPSASHGRGKPSHRESQPFSQSDRRASSAATAHPSPSAPLRRDQLKRVFDNILSRVLIKTVGNMHVDFSGHVSVQTIHALFYG